MEDAEHAKRADRRAGTREVKPRQRTGSRSPTRLTKGERTRRRLVQATREVLAKRGYQNTRIEDIAKAAAVAKGTFYIYFENKQAATLAVMRELMTEGERKMLASRTREDPFLEILEPNVAYARIVFEQAGLFQALMQFSYNSPEAARLWSEITRRWLVRVEAVLDRRLGKGRTDPAARTLAVYAMGWMVDGVLLSFLTRADSRLEEAVRSPEQLAETLSVLWYRAVYGENPDPEQLADGRKILEFELQDTSTASRADSTGKGEIR